MKQIQDKIYCRLIVHNDTKSFWCLFCVWSFQLIWQHVKKGLECSVILYLVEVDLFGVSSITTQTVNLIDVRSLTLT